MWTRSRGKQSWNTTSRGGEILELEIGTFSADEMFSKAEASNRMLTWILRLVGFILMFVGFLLVLRPLSVVADVIPFLGNIVGAGAAIIAFLLAGTLSLITIGVAWIVYRPVLAVALFAGAAVLLVLIKSRGSGTSPGGEQHE